VLPKSKTGNLKLVLCKFFFVIFAKLFLNRSEDKQRRIMQLKLDNTKQKSTLGQISLIPSSGTSLFGFSNKPLMFTDPKVNNQQNAEANKNSPTKDLFSSSANSLFSPLRTSSLFGSSNKSNSLFQTPTKPKDQSASGLFSLAKTPAAFQPSKSTDLFSSKTQSNNLFSMSENPLTKKASLFLNKQESDVTFKVENEEFPAHKYILTEKCKFFKHMFASGMMESYSSVIEISDTKASVFRAFLEFLYLGKTGLNETLAVDLLGLADKYVLDDLRTFCENYLQKVLTLENCVRIFETACSYELTSLKELILSLFQKNLKKIMERTDFDEIPKISSIQVLKMYWEENSILGPPISKLFLEELTRINSLTSTGDNLN